MTQTIEQRAATTHYVSYKYRVKSGTALLDRFARACNTVWNFCVATQRQSERRRASGISASWPTAFDLINLTAGSSALLGVHSDTISQICRRFVQARDKIRRCPKLRKSFGSKASLGWVPFTARYVTLAGGAVTYLKRTYKYWNSRPTSGRLKSGAFAKDARGNWFVSFQCEVEAQEAGTSQVGIDLGLKTLAVCSDGTSVPALQHYRKYADALGRAQRAGNKKRIRAIHAKIANSRKHHLHVASTRIARENKLIVVGDVSSSKLVKTKMAKSVLDAGWYMFKEMLRYKSARRQATFLEVNEAYTSRTCHSCGCIPDSSPKGIGALGVRSWVCSECGVSHDRDINAAKNILRIGLECQPPKRESHARERINTRIEDSNLHRATLTQGIKE